MEAGIAALGDNFTSLWSEPSDPIDILVTEQLSYTPTLSVEPGPSVSPGDNVTLLCGSSDWSTLFLLAKEGTANPPLCVKLDKLGERTKVEFSFHPVTSAHNGTYRCYSSNSFNPYWLSHPSVSLHLWVSGPSEDSGTMHTADVYPLLIGIFTAGALLGLFLLLFFLLICRCHRQAGHRKSGAGNPVPQDTGLNARSRPSAHVQENNPEATITQTQSEERIQLNPQAEASEAPLEVTYAQLRHLDTAQETTAPPSFLSGEPPEEPSVYAALAFQ